MCEQINPVSCCLASAISLVWTPSLTLLAEALPCSWAGDVSHFVNSPVPRAKPPLLGPGVSSGPTASEGALWRHGAHRAQQTPGPL